MLPGLGQTGGETRKQSQQASLMKGAEVSVTLLKPQIPVRLQEDKMQTDLQSSEGKNWVSKAGEACLF